MDVVERIDEYLDDIQDHDGLRRGIENMQVNQEEILRRNGINADGALRHDAQPMQNPQQIIGNYHAPERVVEANGFVNIAEAGNGIQVGENIVNGNHENGAIINAQPLENNPPRNDGNGVHLVQHRGNANDNVRNNHIDQQILQAEDNFGNVVQQGRNINDNLPRNDGERMPAAIQPLGQNIAMQGNRRRTQAFDHNVMQVSRGPLQPLNNNRLSNRRQVRTSPYPNIGKLRANYNNMSTFLWSLVRQGAYASNNHNRFINDDDTENETNNQ